MRLLIKKQSATDTRIVQTAFHFYIGRNMQIIKQYGELFLTFFKIGAFTFGGGYAMVPLIRNEVVEKKEWIDDNEFMDMLAIAQSIPGPISLNTALFVGNKRLGFRGSLFSAAGIILPSFIAILLIAILFSQIRENPVVESIFMGIRPAVVALIAAPLLGLGRSAGVNIKNIWIPIAVALLVWLFKLSPVYIVVTAILMGIGHLFFMKKIMKQ